MATPITQEEIIETAQNEDLTGLVGIDPETGEFDMDMVPENLQDAVKRMAQAMSSDDSILKRGKIKGCNRKRKKKVKKPKTFGKNKKKK